MFEIDDHVIYGNHGVCKVEKIGPVVLPMADKNKIFHRVFWRLYGYDCKG